MNKALYILLWIWQLPQNIIGLILTIGASCIDGIYFRELFNSGVSLGNYIIIDKDFIRLLRWNKTKIKHEQGHSKQSMILGPLYLIAIGIPSVIGNILFRIFKWPVEKYYKQPWEAWADKLGGVKRNKSI